MTTAIYGRNKHTRSKNTFLTISNSRYEISPSLFKSYSCKEPTHTLTTGTPSQLAHPHNWLTTGTHSLVSVPDPKPTPARIAFSIARLNWYTLTTGSQLAHTTGIHNWHTLTTGTHSQLAHIHNWHTFTTGTHSQLTHTTTGMYTMPSPTLNAFDVVTSFSFTNIEKNLIMSC